MGKKDAKKDPKNADLQTVAKEALKKIKETKTNLKIAKELIIIYKKNDTKYSKKLHDAKKDPKNADLQTVVKEALKKVQNLINLIKKAKKENKKNYKKAKKDVKKAKKDHKKAIKGAERD